MSNRSLIENSLRLNWHSESDSDMRSGFELRGGCVLALVSVKDNLRVNWITAILLHMGYEVNS